MNVYLFGVVLVVCVFTIIDAVPKNKECTHGQLKKVDCNNCSCVNGKWVCTTNICSPRPQCISGQYKNEGCSSCRCINGKWSCISSLGRCPPSQRLKRGVPGAAELKHTPCAPNDYFKVDCNTCYCNIDKTGYLCTENMCPYTESPSTESPSNDTLNANNTSVDDVTVIKANKIKAISVNSTVLVTGNANSSELEPLVITDINYTETLYTNSSNFSPSNDTLNANNTSVDDVTVPVIQTISGNSTVLVIGNANSSESPSNHSETEPLVITDIDYTETLYSNSSNFSDPDGGGTSKIANITHL